MVYISDAAEELPVGSSQPGGDHQLAVAIRLVQLGGDSVLPRDDRWGPEAAELVGEGEVRRAECVDQMRAEQSPTLGESQLCIPKCETDSDCPSPPGVTLGRGSDGICVPQ